MTERFEERVPERVATTDGQIVMPFYLVLDVSISMTGDLAALQDGLGHMITAIGIEPDLDDTTQVCVLTFSDVAAVVTPLDQVSKLSTPKLGIQGGTNYGAAFRKLAEVIEADRARLKKQGYQIFRPCAFFLSDGEPNDSGWHQTFTASLTYDRESKRGMLAHPIFVPFGFRDAKEADLKRLAYPPGKGKWYHARNIKIEDALAGILDIIKKSVIDSAQSVPTGQPGLMLAQPKKGSGISQGESEYDDDYV
jgi:uncharacterized protein YegL